jgi:DNA-directed RNA polymerase beta' subunit
MEMNAHIPQSYEAAIELEEIAAVPHQIITPRHAKPIIGVVQDTLVGAYRLTRPGNEFSLREYMNLMMWNKRFDGVLEAPRKGTAAAPRWTGHQVISTIIPPLNIEMENSSYDSNKVPENYVKIREGNVQQGTFDKDIFAKPSKGIIHTTYNDYGPKDTVQMIDTLQNTIEHYLILNGFSVGISDLIADEGTKDNMEKIIQERKKEIEDIILQVHLDLFDNNTGKTNQEEFESRVFNVLNKATELAGKAGQGSLSEENRMMAMVRAGSKGGTINIAQMVACLGQTAIDGKRIPYGFTDRTLPHYKKYDDGAEARGFVESSFIRGLTPQEFFFHAMSGREGLIDTAVKSVTGDTKIIVLEDGVTKCVEIGPWIDGQLAVAEPASVEHYTEANMELLNLTTPVYIPTADAAGVSSWGQLTAVTRHDPGECLYRVKTRSGREVTVAKSKSLIVWDDTEVKFLPKASPDVVCGDFIPVIVRLGTMDGCDKVQVCVPVEATAAANADVANYMISITSADTSSYDGRVNDVIKDEIVEVECLSAEGHPKLYDVTVPSTLNFQIANGIVCLDTADTGYIQRQLVKGMEDIVIQHDGTVRDGNMNLIQVHYGEDGINATKIEGQSLPLGKMSEADIRREFGMAESGATLAAEDTAALAAFVEAVLADRKMLVEKVFGSGPQGGVQSPVNLDRLILNIKIRYGLGEDAAAATDLAPAYVTAGIDRVIAKTQPYNKVWAALLRFHLAPHRIIGKNNFTRAAFDTLCDTIIVKNMQGWAQPGELVGIVAAQSIGEPSTQMSCSKSTVIHIKNNSGANFYGTIGEFIDGLLAANKSRVVSLGNDSVVLDFAASASDPAGFQIVGVSQDEQVSWRPVSQISRHPANGGLVKVTTQSGRTTTATLSHSFLRRSREGIVPVLGSELCEGMRIPIARCIPETPDAVSRVTYGAETYELNKDFGWLCGIYLADGSINGNTVRITKIAPIVEEKLRPMAVKYGWKFSTCLYNGEYGPGKDNLIKSKNLTAFMMENFKAGSYDKRVGAVAFNAPREFIAGLLGGYFDGDGNVNATRQMIRASSRNKALLDDIARLFGYIGIFSTFGEEKSINYPGKIQHTLTLTKKYAQLYKDVIGFSLPDKAAALEEIISYEGRDDKHDVKQVMDMIPELGDVVAAVGKALQLPGQSRNYGRWAKKEAIGRETLRKYYAVFMDEFIRQGAADEQIRTDLGIIRSALDADVVWDKIVKLEYLPDPEEYVYDFTVPGNDSFMVDCNVLVHNTLNSVDHDTPIIIAKNGVIQTPHIGDFIDARVDDEANAGKLQHLPNNQVYLELNDGNDWKAMSCDEDGNVVWTKLEAITRHPVVNEDGSDTILEVELESGRTVKATKAKSFLTLRDNKIVDMYGSDLKVGDVLPITNSLALEQLGHVDAVDVREYLPPTEWIYGTDVEVALAVMKEENEAGNRHWFTSKNGVEFTVPYGRSDAFRDAFVNGRNSNILRAGCVYPKRTRADVSHIPDKIMLTTEFGFFAGAYVAEGMSNNTQIHITNNDMDYLQKIKALMDSWNVGTHIVSENRYCGKTNIRGKTTSLIIHSTTLAAIMSRLFGRISYEKTLPDWVFQAPDAFVRGLIDGYISGDGTVAKKSFIISATSVSEKLLQRFSTLLSRYGIFSSITSRMPEKKNFNSVSRYYTLTIRVHYSIKFAELFTPSVAAKQARMNEHMTMHHRTNTLTEFNGVVMDKVVAIRECRPIKGWVYDLTVETTRNFTALNCIALKDTFHLAGVAAKSNVTRGVPRLKELLKVTQNPKATSLTIYMKPEYRELKEKAREVAQDLELTLLRDITLTTAIYYEPSDEKTVVRDDQELLEFYKLFEAAAQEDAGAEVAAAERPKTWSPWMLRIELNREKMFNKNISMDDVAFVLRDRFPNVNMVYSDYNSNKLVMRIRFFKEDGEDIQALKKFQNRVLNGIVIRGVPGIKGVTFRLDKEKVVNVDGEYKSLEQYVLDTDGSNFLEVANHPAVDANRLYSTNVHDLYEQLGIEAARAGLLQEITGLFDEVGVNQRHLGLLCDIMTRPGKFVSMDRYGINKLDIGPLAKASFEETEKILLKASLFGEVDPVVGVSANIMTGQPIRGGTNFTQVLLDEQALPRLLQGLPAMPTIDEEDEGLDESALESKLAEDYNDPCGISKFQVMRMTMPGAGVALDEEDVEMVIV